MKRLTAFFVLCLTALCFALTASAAGDAIHSVTIGENAVTVRVTAESDCALWLALYGADGGMMEAQSVNLDGERDEQTMALRFGDIPTDAYAKAFLLDMESFSPLTPCGDTRNPSDEPGDEPSDKPGDEPSDEPGDKPSDKPGDEPSDKPGDEPSDKPGDEPSDKPGDEPGDEPSDKPGDEPSDKPGDEPYTSDVYAILYADGTFVFQHGNAPRLGQAVTATYPVNMTEYHGHGVSAWETKHWQSSDSEPVKNSIKRVDIVDKIRPKSAVDWFADCPNLTEIKNLQNLDTSDMNTMNGMFTDCAKLTSLDFSHFNTANVTDISLMFWGCSSLTELDLSSFDTTKVTNMDALFHDCAALTKLNVGNWNTANVTDMSSLFSGCSALEKLDVSDWNTMNVTDMGNMFSECSALTELDVGNWNTANVTDMSSLFSHCSALEKLNVGNWNTGKVTDMSYMFAECSSLTELDVSGFDTANVTEMSSLFSSCSKLKTIYASDKFVTGQATSSDSLFHHCEALIGGKGTQYDGSHRGAEYARIDGGPDNPGYFTAK